LSTCKLIEHIPALELKAPGKGVLLKRDALKFLSFFIYCSIQGQAFGPAESS